MLPPVIYQGEYLLPGKVGHFLIILSFTAGFLSALAYFMSSRREDEGWKRIGRAAFIVHGLAVLSVIGIIFSLLLNHRFEYHYVWYHSSTDLPLKYIFSCFWEGQEGSFLLWLFWQVLLGFILMRKAGSWESGVMWTVALVQAFISSMLLGVYIAGYKLGSNPFVLLREHPEFMNLPFVSSPDYLSMIKDGRGLNPLLRNYWMTIHPPTLFLGFASTLVPFSYAVAALTSNRVTDWIKPALPWAFFSVMILGSGILMGAAWAYEALSFGGFWAWDPVENASLVPWLLIVGGAHVMLVSKHSGHSYFTSFALVMASFILVLYSTFLTRSGILGDASVHAFTDLGMSGQLVFYMAFFFVLAIALLFINRKKIPFSESEESLWSREFWMFIGSLVLVISAIQITFTTSIPVINKVFNTSLAPPAESIRHYNAWQLPIAVIIALMVAITQFFRYQHTEISFFLRRIAPAFVVSVAVALFAAWGLDMFTFHFFALLFTSIFAIVSNADYMFRVLSGRLHLSGSSVAHIGLGFILIGALVANGKKQVISQSPGLNLGKDLPNTENIYMPKGDTLAMGDYYVTYSGRKKEGVNLYFKVDYFKRDETSGKLVKMFSLHPLIQNNPKMGAVAEPATKHYLTKDIFTHITSADMSEEQQPHTPDFVVMKAIVFPYINLLWLGCALFIAGTVIAIVRRVRQHAR